MSGARWVRCASVVATLVVCSPVSAAVFTSNGSGGGNWNNSATWLPPGVPISGDSVLITLGDTITVTDMEAAGTVLMDSVAGSRTLSIGAGGSLTIDGGGTALTLSGITVTGANLVQLDGGMLSVPGSVSVVGGLLSTSTIDFTANGGTLDIGGDLTFGGTPANAQVQFSGGTGTVDIGGNLGAGGTITSAGSTFSFDGTGAQSIDGGYTFSDLAINKAGGTATLSSPTSVSGNLDIFAGTLDLGAQSISVAGTLTNGATLLGSTGTLTLSGDFNNNGTSTLTGATLQLNGTGFQTVDSASDPLGLGSLEMNNPTGANIDSTTSIFNSLLLSGGNITITGSFFVDVAATVTRTSGWLIGPLQMGLDPSPARRFEIGTSASYLPVDVDASAPGTVTIEALEGQHPNKTGPNTLDRYWHIGASTVSTLDSLTFNFSAGDITSGDINDFQLFQYLGGVWTLYLDVVDSLGYTATVFNATAYQTDWVVGTRGSSGFAGKLAITGVNGGSNPTQNTPFDVDVESEYDDGTPANVVSDTDLDLAVVAGTGGLSGGNTTGTILSGTSTGTISGAVYDTAESGVQLEASAISGDILDPGDSASITVDAAPSTLTVTSTADNGPGTLREAITLANGGGCASPCTINFSVAGDIVLLSDLPAITADNLTIDGFSAPSASPNTNAFGQPSNAVIVLSLDGSNGMSVGFEIQATFDKIVGFAIKNFDNGGTGIGVKLSGDNSLSGVSGCYIGTDTTGLVAAPNAYGVVFAGSTESFLGGTAAADRNVIGGNLVKGVVIDDDLGGGFEAGAPATESVSTDTASNTVTLTGNYIGTNATLSTAMPNPIGLWVCSGCSTIAIGSTLVGNVISGNTTTGIEIDGPGVNVIANIIGPAGASTTAFPNGTGILINAGGSATIGGASPAEANTISGNGQNGIEIDSDGTSVNGNRIGVAPDGATAMGNGINGILIASAGANNAIGETQANVIANNGGRGVSLPTTGIGNAIRKNTIYANTDLAIDLGEDGPTSNDATDADTGANDLQNFPTVSAAKLNGSVIDITASLDSTAGVAANNFIIDVYRSNATSPTPMLEYLGGSGCIAGPSFTNTLFSVPQGGATVGSKIVLTATAYSDACTTASEGTSELSALARVAGDIHWINGGGGSWETAANWSPAAVPISTDDAYVDLDANYLVTINSAVSVNALHLGAGSGGNVETLQITGGNSLDIASPSSVALDGVLTLGGTSLGGPGSLNVDGILNWESGNISGFTPLDFGSGATLNIDNAGSKTLSQRLLTVAASAVANWNGGNLVLQSAGGIQNLGLFDIKTDATISDGGGSAGITNSGTFRKSSGAGTTQITGVNLDHSGGTLDVQTGTLNLAGGTAAAPITLSTGTVLEIDSGTFVLSAGTSVSGTGKVQVNGGTLSVDFPLNIPDLELDSGTVDGNATFTAGSLAWNGGQMSGTGTTRIPASSSIVLATTAGKSLARLLDIQSGGTATVSGTGMLSLQSGGSISNAGLFQALADNQLSDGGGAGIFHNTSTGTYRKSGTTGISDFIGIGFTNDGLLDIQSGKVSVGGAFSQSATGTLKVWLGGTTPGTGFGQLSIGSNPAFAGTFEAALVGPYQPIGGDTFRAIDIGAIGHVGDFTHPYTYPVLAGGRTFTDAYDAAFGLVLTVVGNADLSITKSAPSNVVVGSPITYTLTVHNADVDVANDVTVTDTLPTGHAAINAGGGPTWNCNTVVDTVTCTANAPLGNGDAPDITIDANAPASPQSLMNTATVSSSNDPNAGNNDGSANVTVDPNTADIELTALSPFGPVAPLTPFNFDYSVTNNGPQTATGVTFTAQIPSTLSFDMATPSSGLCNFSVDTVNCNLGSILSGNTVHVVIDMTTTTDAGTHSVTGTGAAIEVDPNPGNNSIPPTVSVPGGTVTVTSVMDSGGGSLRQALLDAQSAICTAPCTIDFNIPGSPPYVIQPLTDLPDVASDTTIDATTQSGYASNPIVEIDSSLNVSISHGLVLSGTGSRVKGLAITNANAQGISVSGDSNFIEDCYIGLDTAGNGSPNQVGIDVSGNGNTIGANGGGSRNHISGNLSEGVRISGTANGNTVAGNDIGFDPSGTALPNNIGVAVVDDADANVIGGFSTSDGNIISGNTTYNVVIGGGGVLIIGGAPHTDAGGSADNNALYSNSIGPNVSGTAPLAIGTTAGVKIVSDAVGTIIGTDGSGNVIAGNQNGIILFGPNISGTVIAGNLVGVAPDTITPMGNAQGGIFIDDASDTRIGGTAPNEIANNGGDGIAIVSGAGNQILGNSIYNHPSLGIDLFPDGVDPNDPGDADVGPNNSQNSPTAVVALLLGGGDFKVDYTLDSSSTTSNSILVEIFKADSPGSGSGKTFLGQACIAANSFAAGTSFNAPSVSVGDPIVLTATGYTDADCTVVGDGTSEFSNVVIATNCTPPAASITAPPSTCASSSSNAASVNAPAATTFNWSIAGGTIDSGQGTSSITFTAAASGTVMLSVDVTDNIGCHNTASANVPISAPPTPTISGPTSTCASTPVTLDAGSGFASYLWSTGAVTQMITVSPTLTTNYSVTVTDANGCSGSDSHTVTVTSSPTATINAPAAVCHSSSGNAASVASQAGATYAWTISNGTINGPANGSSISFTAAATGDVTLGVTVTVGSCSSVGSLVVSGVDPPVVTIAGPTTACPNVPFRLDAGNGFASYLWSTGETNAAITPTQTSASVTYSVIVTNAAGCASTATHTVTLALPSSIHIHSPASVAAGATGIIASVDAVAGASYNWIISNGTITAGQGTRQIVFTAGTSGTVRITARVTSGACTVADSNNIAIIGSPPTEADLSITKSAAASVQAGGTLTYTIGVRNNGPAAATGVAIVDTLPAGVSLVSVSGGPWSCAALAPGVRCTGSASSGANSTITVIVTAPPESGAITNSVTISATTPDPNVANNSASATTNVLAAPPTCATEPPTLLAPAEGATVASPATFSWSPLADATSYELWIIADGNPSLAGTTAGTSLTRAVASGPESWFVVAHFGGGCGDLVSLQGTFTVSEGPGCGSHGAPQLTSPGSGASLPSPVAFSWTPVPQAIGYRLWIEANGTAPQDVGTTNGAIMLTAAVPTGSIVAYVDALFSGCPPTRSAPIAFAVTRPDPCAGRVASTPIAPANNAVLSSSSVDFEWTAAAGADGYRVWYSLDGATPAVLGTTTTDTSLHATAEPGHTIWWIEALYAGCASTESSRFHFSIPLDSACPTEPPSPIAPAAGSSVADANVTFSWTSIAGAIRYEVWLSIANGTPTLVGTTTDTSFTYVVPPGALEWFVRAVVDRCPSLESAHVRFAFQPPPGCLDNQRPVPIAPLDNAVVTSPAGFQWIASPGAVLYEVFLIRDNAAPELIGATNENRLEGVGLSTGKLRWFVRAHFDGCSPLDSTQQSLEIVDQPGACSPLTAPLVTAPGQISGGVPFPIQWTSVPAATSYQLQISASADFAGAEIITTSATLYELTLTNDGTNPIARYVRVRAIDGRCQPTPTTSPYGPTAAIFILPQGLLCGASGATCAPDTIGGGSTPIRGGLVTYVLPLGPDLAGATFTATTREPWLTVSPAAGIVGAGGTTLTVTADPALLPVGTSTAAVTITLTTPSAGSIRTNTTTVTLPITSINIVTPVTPTPKDTPPPDALIIPAVAHADGINSEFESDVRVSNTSPQLIKYQLTFTPSGDAGISTGKQTTFSIEPGHTIGLDDILKSWFGTGGDNVTGTLEVRPLTQTTTSTTSAAFKGLANLVTFASSRTFNVTPNGTFGQFIPAIPYANFIGKAIDGATPTLLSLQQIAQSSRYRTNLGLVEGSGQAASLLVKVFGEGGQKIMEFPINLNGGQHTQLNGFLAQHGISDLSDGRVEIEVTSSGGKVTAYASVLDNQTNDPLLVTPVTLTEVGDTKWVVPGVADLDNGFADWQTDTRIFNAGTEDVDATLTFYSQTGAAPISKVVTIPAGEVRQFDKVLSSVFGLSNDGGAVQITTPSEARLIATARTYNQTGSGTYGQFISAVTSDQAAGIDDRPLQLLQIEESNRFRSNIGLTEVTGNDVKVEISVIPPDAKTTIVTSLTLKANEFRQIGSLLKSVGLDETFNARVTVRAVEGEGRVAAYASVIDAQTNDPTYVPAQ